VFWCKLRVLTGDLSVCDFLVLGWVWRVYVVFGGILGFLWFDVMRFLVGYALCGDFVGLWVIAELSVFGFLVYCVS